MKLFGRAEVDLMVSLGQYNEVILHYIKQFMFLQ